MPIRGGAVELRLPGETAYLPVLQGAAAELARMAGFAAAEIPRIQLALEEAAVNAIRHGFEPGEPGELRVGFRSTPTGMEISIRDAGRPFDPQALPTFHPEDLAAHPDQKGLGTFLMGRMVDEVVYRNLGREGMETLLRKHRPGGPQGLPAPEPPGPAAAPSEDPGRISVRALLPGEAEAVSRCAWEAYRSSYPYEHIYDPAKVRDLNASGELRSYVCLTEHGVLFGHAALVRCARQPSTAELGVAFVTPRFRGGGALNLLTAALVEDGRRQELAGLWVHGVTSHPFSQKAAHRLGFQDTALLLAAVVPISFKGIREGDGPRESLVHACLPLRPGGGCPLATPDRHREMLARICRALGREPEFLEPAPPPDGSAQFELSRDAYGATHLQVRTVAADAPERLRRALRGLCLDRVESIYFYLPAADPATIPVAAALEAQGCFLAGLLPGGPGEDLLVLQYLNNRVVDYSGLQLDAELGRALAAHIRGCDPNQLP